MTYLIQCTFLLPPKHPAEILHVVSDSTHSNFHYDLYYNMHRALFL